MSVGVYAVNLIHSSHTGLDVIAYVQSFLGTQDTMGMCSICDLHI